MKKAILFATITISIFASCTKEIGQDIYVDGTHHFCINTIAPTLEPDSNDTKASMQASVKLKWSDGDQISVVNLSTGKTMMGNLTAKVNGDKVSFEGELSGSIKAGNKMAAIYPCQNYSSIVSAPDFYLDLSEQTCTTKDDLQFAAYSLFDCKATGVVEVTSDFSIPVSFNQITLATIDPEKQIDYVDLSNVGNGITFHVNAVEETLELTPSVGKVRVTPNSKLSGKNGALFAYCALASSPASSRTITVKALPKIYCTSWAESAMSSGKFYTSVASSFESQEFKDFMVSAASSLEVGYQGGTVIFSITSNNIDWTATSTPSLSIDPSSGNGCENLEVTVIVPQNSEPNERSFVVTLSGGSDNYYYTIKQKADPNNEIVEFPDINLKKYLLTQFDENEDGQISVVEAEDIVNVNCADKNIADISGLERCPNLKYLNIKGNYVSEIILPDMVKLEAIVAYGNPIEKIVINNDTALSALYLMDVNTNAIYSDTEIRINKYTQTNTLSLSFAGTEFNNLKITNSTVLTDIDVAENVQLKELYAYGNTLVTNIDVSSLTALTRLQVSGNALESLDVSKNIALLKLQCYKNNLTSLKIDDNNLLRELEAYNNQITSLKVSNNPDLTVINVGNNHLQSLNIRKNTLLTKLVVNDNAGITALDVENNPLLEVLNASNTGISDINVSANPNLQSLNISGCTNIHNLDVSVNTDLTTLNASSTSITDLDLSNNNKLTTVNVSKLLLTTLDLLNCTALSSLDVSQCTSITSLAYNGCTTKAIGLKKFILVNISGKKGIVFESTNDAVKVLYAFETKTSYSNSKGWLSNIGEGWRLPSLSELKIIRSAITTLNSKLSEISGNELDGHGYYLSNQKASDNPPVCYYYLRFSSGEAYTVVATTSEQARAVRNL